MADQLKPLFLLGPGFSGLALARIWPGGVCATARAKAKVGRLADQGIEAILVTEQKRIQHAVAGAHVLVSTPPGARGCPGLALVEKGISRALSVTYLSTTGVYGDLGGGWVFEWTPLNPSTTRARLRASAEAAWRRAYQDIQIVRLPGIYGPGRSPLERIKEGRAKSIIKPGQVFSRVHVDDIASGLKALILSRVPGVFHLCDEQPAAPQVVNGFAAALLGLPPPPQVSFEQSDLSALARSFYSECKRVSNARVKSVTGWRPAYPSYREGLTAILTGGG